jgi:hypothetical protein
VFALLAIGVAPAASAAQPASRPAATGPAAALAGRQGAPATVDDVRTLHLVRLNCDDEAETFSDEVNMFINDQFFGSRGNLDGGDWWPLHPEIGFFFEGSIKVTFREDDGWLIGERVITDADAFQGEIVVPWQGFNGTAWRYRFTFFVD